VDIVGVAALVARSGVRRKRARRAGTAPLVVGLALPELPHDDASRRRVERKIGCRIRIRRIRFLAQVRSSKYELRKASAFFAQAELDRRPK
jgi:hypothetical protein